MKTMTGRQRLQRLLAVEGVALVLAWGLVIFNPTHQPLWLRAALVVSATCVLVNVYGLWRAVDRLHDEFRQMAGDV